MTVYKKDWVLDQEAFATLLARLDPDPHRAGQEYELVRSMMIKFFECRGCIYPQDLADETINRVARRASEGEEIGLSSIHGYFFGVARNVLREHMRSPESATPALDSLPLYQHPSEDPSVLAYQKAVRQSQEQRLECLETCACALPPETRQLIISYYEGAEGEQIRNRKRIAEQLGIPINNLRIRVHRIREKLERCVGDCVERNRVKEMELSFEHSHMREG